MEKALTIITPFLNGGLFVKEYIKMLKMQTFKNWVCFLIDDGSIDNSAELIKENSSGDSRFILFKRHHNKLGNGPGEARNYGLKFVETELVAFCDIDDLWHPNKLDKQLRFHRINNLDLSITSYFRFSGNLKRNIKSIVIPPKKITYLNLLKGNSIPFLTVIIKNEYLKNGFPLVEHEDYALWLNLFKNTNIKAKCLNEKLAFYRVHPNNLTKNKLRMFLWVLKVFKYHGLKGINLYLTFLIWSINKLMNTFRELNSYVESNKYMKLFD